jgi:hypothetical protein
MIILCSNPHYLKIAQKLGKACKKLVIHASKPVEKIGTPFQGCAKATSNVFCKTPRLIVRLPRQRGPAFTCM